MQKDFDRWNYKKKFLEDHAHAHLPFHEREIWWCSLGLNLGDEQDGKNEYFERPVLVFRKFNDRLAWVIPLTSRLKKGIYYHTLTYGGRDSILILSQLRLVSVKRFRRFVRKVSLDHFDLIRAKLRSLF